MSKASLVVFAVFVTALLLYSSFYTVPVGHVGIVYSAYSGTIRELPLETGRHFLGPGFALYLFPTTDMTEQFTGANNNYLSTRTQDGLEVKLEIVLQYSLMPGKIFDIFEQFLTEYRPIVRVFQRDIVRSVCSKYSAIEYFTKRTEIINDIFQALVTALHELGVNVGNFQLHNIDLPGEFENAISNQQATERRIVTARNEREQRVKAKETERLSAQAKADVLVRNARAEATSYLISVNATAAGSRTIKTAKLEAISTISEFVGFSGPTLVRFLGNEVLKYHNGKKLTFNIGEE
ncbi:hypothetical protein RCL1_003862 [Eukaryota sp. TZLM3-RCL]